MSRKTFLAALVFMVLGLVLSACTCNAGSLLPPDLVSPDWREVMDGSAAVLEWSYPDTCEPDEFEIILSQERDYSVIEHTQLVSGIATTYTPPTLDIAEEYFWRVRAKVGSTYGPYSLQLRSFFTLPYCTAGDLTFPPSLISPPPGGFFDRAYDSLEWEWQINSCIPESYRIEVSRDSGFVDTTYNGATGSPGTRWGFGSTPPAATQFWWRVSAFSDGIWGSPSATHTFTTDPMCTSASLVDAVAETPLDDDIVNTLTPEFTWSYPDPSCAPEGFHFQSSETSDMSTIFIDADNPIGASMSMQAGYPYNDCQEYYWRVAVVTEGVQSAYTTPRRFIVDSAGTCDCVVGTTTIPVQTDPGNYQILPDTNAYLRWRNPGGCFPDGAAVQIATDYDYADSTEFTFPGEFVVGYDPPGLDPATQYRWKAAYYVEDAGSPAIGDYSGTRSFFTGPECTSLTEVVAPVRLAPADGLVVHTLTTALKFTPGIPGCIPDGYLLHLHTMADFSDPNLLTENAFPATTVLTDLLIDCEEYFWSVTAVQGGGYGPESDVGSFSVDVDGTCLPGVPATAEKNNFCREGTFPEHHDAIWTYKAGDHALAIARNPFNTYLKLIILDQETHQPLKEFKSCWSVWQSFEEGWQPPDPPEGQYDFKELPIEEPPPTPVPTKIPACYEKLSQEDCKARGGKFNLKTNECDCPSG